MHQQTHQPAAAAAAAAWSMVRAAAAAAAAAAAREVIDDVCFTGPRCACAASTFANRFPVLFFKVVAVLCGGTDACGVKEVRKAGFL